MVGIGRGPNPLVVWEGLVRDCYTIENKLNVVNKESQMKGIALALVLISPFSFADWGDVYYCQMTTWSETTLEGKRTDYTLEKFQFKLDKTKNAMAFGKGGYFNTIEYELVKGDSVPSLEMWYARPNSNTLYFYEGKFLYSHAGLIRITSISADCDKF